jgi:hypothetical protein
MKMASCLDVIRRNWYNAVGIAGQRIFGGRCSFTTGENKGTEGR